jgi:hypothetical protein
MDTLQSYVVSKASNHRAPMPVRKQRLDQFVGETYTP